MIYNRHLKCLCFWNDFWDCFFNCGRLNFSKVNATILHALFKTIFVCTGSSFLAHGLALVMVCKGLLLLWNMSSEEVGSLLVAHGLSWPAACGLLGPQPGIEPTFPALEDGFLTTGPPGKSFPMLFCSDLTSPSRGRIYLSTPWYLGGPCSYFNQ